MPRKPLTEEQKKALAERLKAGKEKKKAELAAQGQPVNTDTPEETPVAEPTETVEDKPEEPTPTETEDVEDNAEEENEQENTDDVVEEVNPAKEEVANSEQPEGEGDQKSSIAERLANVKEAHQLMQNVANENPEMIEARHAADALQEACAKMGQVDGLLADRK